MTESPRFDVPTGKFVIITMATFAMGRTRLQQRFDINISGESPHDAGVAQLARGAPQRRSTSHGPRENRERHLNLYQQHQSRS
jgi:hypothetical protein